MTGATDIVRVSCRQSFDGVEDQVNVFHFIVQTVPDPNTEANIMADLGDIISTAFEALEGQIVNNVQPVDMTFYNVSDDVPIGVTTWPGPYSGGTGSGEGLPPHDSALVILPVGAKRTQGRIYLPTMLEASQNDGVWVAGVHTAVDAFLSLLLDIQTGTPGGGEYQYGIWKRSNTTMHYPYSGRLSSQVAVQRRRKRGRGS